MVSKGSHSHDILGINVVNDYHIYKYRILAGAAKFYDNIEMMIGFRINPWLRICWTIMAPIICAVCS